MKSKSSWPKYRDFEGHFSLDFVDKGEDGLFNLLGISSEDFYLIGIEFGTATIQGVTSTFTLTAICVDIKRYPGFDATVRQVSQNKGLIDVEELSCQVSFSQFFSLMKRFGGLMYRRGIEKFIKEIITPDLDDLGL